MFASYCSLCLMLLDDWCSLVGCCIYELLTGYWQFVVVRSVLLVVITLLRDSSLICVVFVNYD